MWTSSDQPRLSWINRASHPRGGGHSTGVRSVSSALVPTLLNCVALWPQFPHSWKQGPYSPPLPQKVVLGIKQYDGFEKCKIPPQTPMTITQMKKLRLRELLMTDLKPSCWLKAELAFFFVVFFMFFAIAHSIWDFSSPTRDWTHAPFIGSTES